ncbi:MAG TPA: hypothetical protein DDW30_08550 [Clostridiales bacterium]|nr:hypothetical protein [Clostridiales bacterium]
MRLDREQVLSLSEVCHIALTEEEAAALKTELNELLALAERLTDGNAAEGLRGAQVGMSAPCRDAHRVRAVGSTR